VPAPGDYDDGEIGRKIGWGSRWTRRKPAPVPLCAPQTPHIARTRTRAAAVGSQRITAWATARPITSNCNVFHWPRYIVSCCSWFPDWLQSVYCLLREKLCYTHPEVDWNWSDILYINPNRQNTVVY
jgi:hypothetical protein